MEEGTGRHRGLLVLCSVLSLVAGGLIGFFTPHPRSQPVAVITPDPTATPSPYRVYVSGAVNDPAVYRLAPGCLIEDAVTAAGGAAPGAALHHINLAQEVFDQQQVYVPYLGEADTATPPSGGPGTVAAAQVIDINTATTAQLETLPYIGSATAQRIVAYRETVGPFESIEEIMEVPGIGPATFEEIRGLITVGDSP